MQTHCADMHEESVCEENFISCELIRQNGEADWLHLLCSHSLHHPRSFVRSFARSFLCMRQKINLQTDERFLRDVVKVMPSDIELFAHTNHNVREWCMNFIIQLMRLISKHLCVQVCGFIFDFSLVFSFLVLLKDIFTMCLCVCRTVQSFTVTLFAYLSVSYSRFYMCEMQQRKQRASGILYNLLSYTFAYIFQKSLLKSWFLYTYYVSSGK